MELQCLKLFIMTKTKKNKLLEDFREISLVGSRKNNTVLNIVIIKNNMQNIQ